MDVARLSAKFAVRRMTSGDIDLIHSLCVKNPLYYKHCPPFVTRESIAKDMLMLPPRATYDDKHYIGFFRGDRLVAVMDLILGYPDSKTAFVGFFMVNKNVQGKGVGSIIVNDCFSALKDMGYEHIRLGYAEGNPQSEAFWRKNGFANTGITYDNDAYRVIVMGRDLR